jgi:type IV secretory pathway VirB4 component
LDKYRQSNLITSKIKFKSSQVNHEFNKHQDYLIGYATDTAMPISLYYEIMKRHIMIIGQSGTGKSVLITSFLFQHALKGGGFLYCDGKNDLEIS